MSAGRVTIVVLAAGASVRLGRPKQLVALAGTPLVAHAARTALDAALGPVLVVLGAQAEAVEAALRGLDVVPVRNARWEEGIGSSIAAGVREAARDPACEAVLVMTCDQPGVTADHLRALAALFGSDDADTVASAYGGSVGVPALFARRRFDELRTLTPDAGAKALLVGARSIPCPACEADIDRPEDIPVQ